MVRERGKKEEGEEGVDVVGCEGEDKRVGHRGLA
jgi:hypothetical protein